jgi:RecJ-like exonuclease
MGETSKDKAGATETICPLCNGAGVVAGTCACDMEWRGNQQGEEWSDCQCTPNETCPTCQGTGVVAGS